MKPQNGISGDLLVVINEVPHKKLQEGDTYIMSYTFQSLMQFWVQTKRLKLFLEKLE